MRRFLPGLALAFFVLAVPPAPSVVQGQEFSALRFARNALQGVLESAGEAGTAAICSIALPEALCDIVVNPVIEALYEEVPYLRPQESDSSADLESKAGFAVQHLNDSPALRQMISRRFTSLGDKQDEVLAEIQKLGNSQEQLTATLQQLAKGHEETIRKLDRLDSSLIRRTQALEQQLASQARLDLLRSRNDLVYEIRKGLLNIDKIRILEGRARRKDPSLQVPSIDSLGLGQLFDDRIRSIVSGDTILSPEDILLDLAVARRGNLALEDRIELLGEILTQQ